MKIGKTRSETKQLELTGNNTKIIEEEILIENANKIGIINYDKNQNSKEKTLARESTAVSLPTTDIKKKIKKSKLTPFNTNNKSIPI